MTITLCNGKGGSGKTTLSVLLGAALVEAGHQVALLDTDPQNTATRWIQEMQQSPEGAGLQLAKEGGVKLWILKPFVADKLLQAVAKVMEMFPKTT